jgi:predicted Zn-dependent protease
LEEAQKALDESHELQPENAWLFYFRALLHIAQKEEKLACQDFQLALVSNQPPIPPRKKAKAEAYIKRFSDPKTPS